MHTRLEPFTDGLYQKANLHMINFYIIQTLIIVFAAAIPIINVIPTDSNLVRMLSALLGGGVAIGTGFLQLTKLRESGIIFTHVSSLLQKEYHSFVSQADNYSSSDPIKRARDFVKNVESLIMNATSEYYGLFQQGVQQGRIEHGEPDVPKIKPPPDSK